MGNFQLILQEDINKQNYSVVESKQHVELLSIRTSGLGIKLQNEKESIELENQRINN